MTENHRDEDVQIAYSQAVKKWQRLEGELHVTLWILRQKDAMLEKCNGYQAMYHTQANKLRTELAEAKEMMGGWCAELAESKEEVSALQKYVDIAQELGTELAEAKKKFKDLDNELMCELRDPAGTIWEHAKKQQDELDALRKMETALAQYRDMYPWVDDILKAVK